MVSEEKFCPTIIHDNRFKIPIVQEEFTGKVLKMRLIYPRLKSEVGSTKIGNLDVVSLLLIQTQDSVLQLVNVLLSTQNGKILKVFQYLPSFSGDDVPMVFLWYMNHSTGSMAFSLERLCDLRRQQQLNTRERYNTDHKLP